MQINNKSIFTERFMRYAWILVPFTIAMFFSKAGFNLPIALLIISGFLLLYLNFDYYRHYPHWRYFIVLTLAGFLPILMALPDAVNFKVSFENVSARFLLLWSGLFFIFLSQNRVWITYISTAVVVLVIVWCVDALVQYFLGFNIYRLVNYVLGTRLDDTYKPGTRLTGMFLKHVLGIVVACLSPLVFEGTRLYWRRHKWLLLAPFLVFFIVMLSSIRTGWIMLFTAIVLYCIYLVAILDKRIRLKLVLPTLVGVALLSIVAYQAPVVKHNARAASVMAKLDYRSIELGTACRLSIWIAAAKMGADNWINGVGTRGFRHAYMKYRDKNANSCWGSVEKEILEGTKNFAHTHPHQTTLEIWAETGIIGIIGFIIILGMLIRLFIQGVRMGHYLAVPWLIAALTALNPINSGLALYGNYWASFTWIMILMSIAAAVADREPQKVYA